MYQIESRLDSTITFTIVRFFYDFMTRSLAEMEIFFACYLLFLSSSLALKVWTRNNSAETIILTMVQNFSAMLISQNLTRSITGYVDAKSGMHVSVSGMRLVAGISMLLSVATLPEYVLQKQFTQTSISLLLYMLTDSSSSILTNIDVGTSVVFVCMLSMAVLRLTKISTTTNPILVYPLKLVNMVIVNLLILSIVSPANHENNADVQAVQLLISVFVVDTLGQSDQIFMEARDYAVWKSAQQLYAIYSTFAVDDYIMIYVSVLILLVTRYTLVHSSTLSELILLMSVNQILNSIENVIVFSNYTGDLVLLIFYVMVIHTIKDIVFR